MAAAYPEMKIVLSAAAAKMLPNFFPDTDLATRTLIVTEGDTLALGIHTLQFIAAPVPHCGEELMRVVPLRRLGKSLGCEKIVLKQQRMTMHFVSAIDSPFYQSEAFDHILSFVAQHPRRCQFREQNGKRLMVITDVPTIDEAVKLLAQIQEIGRASCRERV